MKIKGNQLGVSPVTGYRRKGTRFSSLKKIFIDDVTVESIFEPLHCYLANSIAEHAKKTLKSKGFDVAGVKKTESGEVIGYVVTDELANGELRNYVKGIDLELLISDSTPIADIFTVLTNRDFAFVLYGKNITGIITKADINKPPVRIYLFGMISLFEMHLNSWINDFYPDNTWERKITDDKRRTCARDNFEKRKGNNQDLSFVECLQLCDKREILKESDDFIKKIDIPKKCFNTFAKRVEKIRNNLAHSQNSIIGDIKWDVFVETLSHLENFLKKSDIKAENIATKY
ncbi:MAG: CBS domain-containing protein [Candidatus Anammoxibacter sp.]